MARFLLDLVSEENQYPLAYDLFEKLDFVKTALEAVFPVRI